MSLTAAAIRLLSAKGLTVDEIADVADANSDAKKDNAAEKRRAYDRERKRKSTGTPVEDQAAGSTGNSTGTPPETPPLTRVRDITSNSEITGTLSLAQVREWSGDSLADMARSPGVAVLHGLKAAMRGANPCSLEDVEAGIISAAAWFRRRHGPGSMGNWDLAVKMAGEARDRRQAGAPEASEVVPLRSTGPPQRFTEQSTQAWDEATKRILADG